MAKVVLVENEPALSHELACRLSSMGHEVVETADGHEALDTIAEIEPDIVITDVAAPFEAELVDAVALEEKEGHADMSLLLLASGANKSEVVEGLVKGADDYVMAPIDDALLGAKINSLMRKKRNMMEMLRFRQLSDGVERSMLAGTAFVVVTAALGLATLLLLYAVKSALGIDIFKDVHFADFF